MKLTAEKVDQIFMDCLFKERPQKGAEYIPGKGIMINVDFDPVKIEEHAETINELLHELPETFMEYNGGGYSFLAACEDKHGNHWGEHNTMDKLFTLGFASGYAENLLPKELWSALPGGMPYIVVLNERKMIEKENL